MNYYHYIDIRRRVLCKSQAVPSRKRHHVSELSASLRRRLRRNLRRLPQGLFKIEPDLRLFSSLISYPGSLALVIVKMPNFTFYRQGTYDDEFPLLFLN